MRRWAQGLTWLRFVLVVLIAGAAAVGVVVAELRLGSRIEVALVPLAVPADTAGLKYGGTLFAARHAECPGAGAGARPFDPQQKWHAGVHPRLLEPPSVEPC